jgi:predicted RNase H-like nuclease (RuvC/YqgF family)
MDDGDDKPVNPLAECQEVVQHLKEENAQLRESAQTFGDLAERLNSTRRPRNSRMSGKSSKRRESSEPTTPK